MNVLKLFNFVPIVMIGSTILVIISLMIKEKNSIKKVLFNTGCFIALIYMFILFGIAVPVLFLGGMFENGIGYIVALGIILVVWTLVSVFFYLKNNILFFKNTVKDIYIRDVDVKYSPAVLSYLMNNKIETKKDLPATLLNLCAKGVLRIEKKEDKVNIIDLKNTREIEKLPEDERYAYDMFVSGVTNNKINSWKDKIKEEYKKHRFSKENDVPLGAYIFGLYVILFIGIFAYMIITGEYTITGKAAQIIGYVLIATFIGAWEMFVISYFKTILFGILKIDYSKEFRDIYTKKGAKEFTRWKKFEKFIEEFSLIKEREHDSIAIWGKYLSYSIALGINNKCDKELYDSIDKEYHFKYNLFYDMFKEM